jgi:hypothetical protein
VIGVSPAGKNQAAAPGAPSKVTFVMRTRSPFNAVSFHVLNNEEADLRGFAPETLRRARLAHQESRVHAAWAFLEDANPSNMVRTWR